MLAVHVIAKHGASVRPVLPRRSVETGALAFVIFADYIFLRPIGQFSYFQL